MTRTPVLLSSPSLVLLVACADKGAVVGGAAPPAAPPSTTPPLPAVGGWCEYPLRDGAISIQPAKWRTGTVDIAVSAGPGPEYTLAMNQCA